jgi:2-oxoglutarate ferredoxin oxidoreductase subunit beta
LILDGPNFKVVDIGDSYSIDDLLIHNPKDRNLGLLISEMTYDEDLPVPIGIFYKEDKPAYDAMMIDQIDKAKVKDVDLQSIIKGPNSWYVK